MHVFGDTQQIIASEIFTLRTDPSSREIFALDTNSWTSVTGFPFFILFESKSVCLHGALHWKGSRNEGKSFSLVAFDLGSEEFRLITPPEEIARLSCLTKVMLFKIIMLMTKLVCCYVFLNFCVRNILSL